MKFHYSKNARGRNYSNKGLRTWPYFLSFLFLSLFLSGCGRPNLVGTNPATSNPTSTALAKKLPDNSYVLKPFSETQKLEKQDTEVEKNYPIMDYPAHPQLARAFNAIVKEKVDRQIDSFLAEVSVSEKSDSEILEQIGAGEMGNEIRVNVVTTFSSESLISLHFYVMRYYYSAAHPLSESFSFNFDLNEGRELAVAELFKPGVDYLKLLSMQSLDLLTDSVDPEDDNTFLDLDWVQVGTARDIKNFHTVNIIPSGLLVTFDSYQIAPYAAGPRDVEIRFTEVDEEFKAGLIDELLKI